jgi:hypothetical protein
LRLLLLQVGQSCHQHLQQSLPSAHLCRLVCLCACVRRCCQAAGWFADV